MGTEIFFMKVELIRPLWTVPVSQCSSPWWPWWPCPGIFPQPRPLFTSLNRIRLKNKADNGDRRAARTLELAEDYDRLLSTILIGNNIVNNVATTIGAVLFIKLIDDVRGPTVSAIVLTIVILIFGERSPQEPGQGESGGLGHDRRPLLRLLVVILTPASFLFTQ